MSYLRIKLKHHRSAADDKLLQRQMQTRQEQLRAAVHYCNDEGFIKDMLLRNLIGPMVNIGC